MAVAQKYTSKDISSLSALTSQGALSQEAFTDIQAVTDILELTSVCLEEGQNYSIEDLATALYNNGRPSISNFYLNGDAKQAIKFGETELLLSSDNTNLTEEMSQDGKKQLWKVKIVPIDLKLNHLSLTVYATPVLNGAVAQQFLKKFTTGKCVEADFEKSAASSVPEGEYTVERLQESSTGRSETAYLVSKTNADAPPVLIRVAPGVVEAEDVVCSDGTRLVLLNRFNRKTLIAVNPGIGEDLSPLFDENNQPIFDSGRVYKFTNPIYRGTDNISIDVTSREGETFSVWKADRLQIVGADTYAKVEIKESAKAANGYTVQYTLTTEAVFNNQKEVVAGDVEVAF